MELQYTVTLLFESAPSEACLDRVKEHFEVFLKAVQDDDLATQLFDAEYALTDERL